MRNNTHTRNQTHNCRGESVPTTTNATAHQLTVKSMRDGKVLGAALRPAMQTNWQKNFAVMSSFRRTAARWRRVDTATQTLQQTKTLEAAKQSPRCQIYEYVQIMKRKYWKYRLLFYWFYFTLFTSSSFLFWWSNTESFCLLRVLPAFQRRNAISAHAYIYMHT